MSLQAHTDQLEILADKEITVMSVNDSIEIKAKEKIVLQAGPSAITLEGGDITFACPGKFSVKGGKLFDKGASGRATFYGLSSFTQNIAPFPASYSRQANISALLRTDPELARTHHEISSSGEKGQLLARGAVDNEALSDRIYTENPEDIEIILGENEWGIYEHIDSAADQEAEM